MNITDLEYFRNLLIAREQGLTELLRPSALPGADNSARVRSLLADMKEALGRVEDGTYGTCEVCCETIGQAATHFRQSTLSVFMIADFDAFCNRQSLR